MKARPRCAAFALVLLLPGAATAQDLVAAAADASLALALAAEAEPKEKPLDDAAAFAFHPLGADPSFDPDAWRASLGLAPEGLASRVEDVQIFVLNGAGLPVEVRPDATAVPESGGDAPDPANLNENPAVSRLAAFAEPDRAQSEDAGAPDLALKASAAGAYAVAYSPPELPTTAGDKPDDGGAATIGIVEVKATGTLAVEAVESAAPPVEPLDAGDAKAAVRTPTPRPVPAQRLAKDVPALLDLLHSSGRAARKAVPTPAPEPVGLL
jgi:hypothetical protein